MDLTCSRLKAILVFLVCGLSFLKADALARRAIPVEVLGYPVLISVKDGPRGSGFYLDSRESIHLVTARHILFNDLEPVLDQRRLVADTIALTSYRPDVDDRSWNDLELDLDLLFRKGAVKPHQSHDVVVVKIGKRKNTRGQIETAFSEGVTARHYTGLKVALKSSIKRFRSVYIGNDVILFGYPSSLGVAEKAQIAVKEPLLRKGIIAGKNREKETLILDCPSYPGFSGGPVLEIEYLGGLGTRFSVIGVVSEFIPFYRQAFDLRTRRPFFRFVNSGYSVAVPMDQVLELLE